MSKKKNLKAIHKRELGVRKMNTGILGEGIYSISQASKLIDISYQKMRRWIKGYIYKQHLTEQMKKIKAITRRNLPVIDDNVAISFVNLIETMVVKKFIEHGVSLKAIRKASKVAAEYLNVSHPFAYRGFKTYNKQIFMEIKRETQDPKIIELTLKRQYFINSIIDQYLKNVDFDNVTELALRWWPLGKKNFVVLDPKIVFGAPIISDTRIETEVLANLFCNGNSIIDISNWYEIEPIKIKAAIEFQEKVNAA